MNPSDPRAVRVILRWPGSDPRPIYLATLLQQLHLQPFAVLEFLTAMMDYVAACGSILATHIQGWGSIGDQSPAPPHCQQVGAEAPPRLREHRPCNANPRTPAQSPKQQPNQNLDPNAPPSGNPRAPPEQPPKKGRGSRGSPPARSRPATPQWTPPRGPPPTPRCSRSPSPGPRPRSPPNPLARLPREPRPPPQPLPKSKAKPKARGGGGCKYKAGEQVYVVFRGNGEWGVKQGKEALAACAPLGVGETWISFPKDPELFAIPRASVWKTKTQAKKSLAKMMAAEEEDKEDDADADEENDGDESNDGDGDGGDEGDGPGAGLDATGANRDGGVEGVEGERMDVEGVEGEGVVGEGGEGEGVVGEGVEGEGVVVEGVVVGKGDGGDSGAGDKSSGAPAGPPTMQDF